jgi:predicted CXXCH cytochrome family protein
MRARPGRWIISVLITVMFSASTFAGVIGSKHDLTQGSPGPSNPALLEGVDLCVYCHAPHDVVDSAGKPLWNRSEPVTVAYTMYGTTISGTTSAPVPNRTSLRCLSCHDGATAVDAFGGRVGSPDKTVGPPYNVGGGGIVVDDHPVSIGVEGIPVSVSSLRSTGLTVYEDEGTPTLECPSCHDPHRTENGKFLRIAFTGGALCQACHAK